MLRTHSRQGRRFVLFSVCSTRRRRSPRYSPCARFPREQTVWGETYTSWADEISLDEVHILPHCFPVCLVMQRRAIQQFHEVGIDAIQPRGMFIRGAPSDCFLASRVILAGSCARSISRILSLLSLRLAALFYFVRAADRFCSFIMTSPSRIACLSRDHLPSMVNTSITRAKPPLQEP